MGRQGFYVTRGRMLVAALDHDFGILPVAAREFDQEELGALAGTGLPDALLRPVHRRHGDRDGLAAVRHGCPPGLLRRAGARE